MKMKKYATMAVIAMALMLVIGFAGSAFSEDAAVKTPVSTGAVVAPGQTTAATTMNCSATCPKFVDNNKDGICDSVAVHHAGGKCANMAQCMKDGKCPGTCKNHAGMMGSGTAKNATMPATCDPTKCTTMPNGCPMKAKAGCKTTK